jgi:hypothetical protein
VPRRYGHTKFTHGPSCNPRRADPARHASQKWVGFFWYGKWLGFFKRTRRFTDLSLFLTNRFIILALQPRPAPISSGTPEPGEMRPSVDPVKMALFFQIAQMALFFRIAKMASFFRMPHSRTAAVTPAHQP